ncbi:MAG: hypothetical protein GX783_07000 [Clostridiales bacterium]|nr:hypothetical protein [Clostridiales bacterium]
MKRVWTLTIACLILLLFFFPSTARAEGVTMEAEVGYEGSYLLGHWTPIRVQLENSGGNLEGSLEVRVKTGRESSLVYSTPVSLPNTSEKEYIIYARMHEVERILNINLIDGNGKLVKTLKLDSLNPVSSDKYFMGLVTDDQPSLGYWQEKLAAGNYLSNYEPISLDATNFPNRKETLAAFSVLIFNNIDTSSFRPEQISALDSWIKDGGILIIGSGVNGKRTLSGLSGNIISASPAELKAWDSLEIFEEMGKTAILGNTPLQVLDIRTDEARTLIGDEQGSLVFLFEKEKGSVYLAGFDLGTEPIISWTGNKLFWESLISQSLTSEGLLLLRYPGNKISYSSGLSGVLGSIEAMEMPSITLILFLFLFYLALAGPFNYIFLKKIDKREWSWVTIPVLSVLFAALIFGFGYNSKGGELIVNTISLARMDTNTAQADISNQVGIFIPRRGDYEVEVDRFALLSLNTNNSGYGYEEPVSQAKVVQDNPSKILYKNANIWTMETFQTDTRQVDIGSIKSELYYEMGKVKGTVKNDTAYPLEHLVIYTSNSFVKLGNIAAGESKNVVMDLPLSGVYNHSYYDIIEDVFPWSSIRTVNSKENRKSMSRRDILEHVINEDYNKSNYTRPMPTAAPIPLANQGTQYVGISYFAFYEGEPETGILINGREADRVMHDGIIIGSMDLLVEKSGMISIPPGMIMGSFEEDMSRLVDHGGDMFYIHDNHGYAVFSIDMSPYMHLQDLRILLGSGVMYGNGIMQIFNLDEEDYADIRGESITIDSNNLDMYVDVDNMIYLKAVPNHDYAEVGLPTIALEGREP